MARATAFFQMDDLQAHHNLQEISQQLSDLEGIVAVSSSPYDPKVGVRFDSDRVSEEEIDRQMHGLGYFPVEQTGRPRRL